MQLLDLLQQLKQAHKKEESSAKKKDTPSIPSDLVRLFTFRELDAAILAANTLQGFYQGKNTLYKDPQAGDYYLILHQSQHTIAEFNQVYHLISSSCSRRNIRPVLRLITKNISRRSSMEMHYSN